MEYVNIMKIFVTGVHSTPAFAVIDELLSRHEYEIYYLGQKHTMLWNDNLSAEYNVALSKNITFINFFAGKLSKGLSLSSFIWWIRIPFGYIQSIYLLLKLKPKIIVTFGAHIGVPIAMVGYLLKIPVIIHEQTIIETRSTKAIRSFSNNICYSWKQLGTQYKSSKYIFTGNPIRKEVFEDNTNIEFSNTQKKTVFIFCGNQGSHSINQILLQALGNLTLSYNVIVQTGNNAFNDYESMVVLAKELNIQECKVIIKDYIYPSEIGSYYNKADIIVCRAGINSITEIAALGKIALIVPHPFTAGNEQILNAQMLKNMGIAEIILQKDLSKELLIKTIDHMFLGYDKYQINIKDAKLLIKRNAEIEIADIIEKYLYY